MQVGTSSKYVLRFPCQQVGVTPHRNKEVRPAVLSNLSLDLLSVILCYRVLSVVHRDVDSSTEVLRRGVVVLCYSRIVDLLVLSNKLSNNFFKRKKLVYNT